MTTIDNIPVGDITNRMVLAGMPRTTRVRVSFEVVQEPPQKNKWEEMEKRNKQYSPLTGLSHIINEGSREFREDFEFKHDSK